MYLHIGGQFAVLFSEIIAILRVDKMGKNNKDYFKEAAIDKKIINVTQENRVKTCIITEKNIYLTSISTLTLVKRIEQKLVG